MKKKLLLFVVFCITVLFGDTQQQYAEIGDLTLVSGQVIKNCKIGYRIIGEANTDSSNIIIYPTWFGGTSEHIITVIKKHKLVDYDNFMVIAIDALGNGISTSPSNTQHPLPLFTIEDMVNSQYKMLVDILNIHGVYGIVGGSMGSFQAFQWLVSYPFFAKKAIPYVSSPVRTSSDKLWLNLEKDIILLQREYKIPDGKTQRIIDMLTAYIAKTQNQLSREIDHDEFQEYYSNFKAVESKTFTLENRLSQINAMLHHDITKSFDYSLEKTARQIQADLLIIVSDSDQIVNPQPAIKFAELTSAQLLILSNECGHLAPSCDMELFTKSIHHFLMQ